jgi:flagellar basal-body rod protein FlgG
MQYAVQGASRKVDRLDIITNHMANSTTTGFKTQVMAFDEVLRPYMTMDTSQGDLVVTDSPLDLAIVGEGFFKVQTDQGIRYTRNGNFALSPQGTLINSDGKEVLGTNGAPITIDGDEIVISGDGTIEVDGTAVGTLDVVTFQYNNRLRKEGGSLISYVGPTADEQSPSDFQVKQGHLEQSNVKIIREMTDMVTTNRHYESFQKLIQTIDELNEKAVTQVGQVG